MFGELPKNFQLSTDLPLLDAISWHIFGENRLKYAVLSKNGRKKIVSDFFEVDYFWRNFDQKVDYRCQK